jgi:hypothetical protein
VYLLVLVSVAEEEREGRENRMRPKHGIISHAIPFLHSPGVP